MRVPEGNLSLTQDTSTEAISLGNEPPIVLGEETRQAPVRRAVSVRWLGGTILTGLTSMFLMGGALMAALDSANQLATPQDLGASNNRNVNGGFFGQKGDRILATEQEEPTRQLLQVSTVTRHGERDFIKLRPFVKIAASLSLAKENPEFEIPEYDVLRIFADSSQPNAGALGESASASDGLISETSVDGEVSVKVSPLQVNSTAISSVALDKNAVEQIVRAAAKFGDGDDIELAGALEYADDGAYDGDFGFEPDEEPYPDLGVSIVAENVSSVAKSDLDVVAGQITEEKVISIGGNEEFLALLKNNDLPDNDASDINAALSELIDLARLGSGNKVRIAYAIDEYDGTTERPVRVSVYDDGVHQATVARSDADRFVRADAPVVTPDTVLATDTREKKSGALPRVYDALYRTALEQQVPEPLIDELVRIFAFDVDFQARIGLSDSIEVFHSLPDTDERDVSEPEILFAALNIGGAPKRFYRFRTADDGYVDYYDEDGRSAKKFLMRKPVSAGALRSRFGMRKHPITGRRRLHAGVDYAARRGTPILAAGNGRIEKAGRAGGYGNLIVVKHTNGYQTRYAHLHRYAKGIEPGVRVRQGQIIGYVGSTGLSTGPHLHFEIRVNKKPVNPLRIRLPRGRVLEGEMLATFKNERSRIDALLGNQASPTTLASAQ